MAQTEYRQALRHKLEIDVSIHKRDEKIPASLIDISQRGIGLVSEKGLFPGTEVDVELDYLGGYGIHGIVRWERVLSHDGVTKCRLGIETDQMVAPEDIWKNISA